MKTSGLSVAKSFPPKWKIIFAFSKSYLFVKASLLAYASTILPMNIVWSPVVNWLRSLHSRWAMHSFIMGGFTFLAGCGVRCASVNLLWFLPLILPQSSVSSSLFVVGMLITNSSVSWMRVCECLFGAMLIATRGGVMEVGIAQARVMMFGFPVLLTQETRTVCMG